MPPARRSLSSVVKFLLDASWYFVALALVLAVCLLLLVTFSEPGQIQLDLGIPVTFEMTLRADGPLSSLSSLSGLSSPSTSSRHESKKAAAR